MKYRTLPPTLSRKEAAALGGVTVRTVTNLISRGEIKSTKVGSRRRIHTRALLDRFGLDPDDVLAFLNA